MAIISEGLKYHLDNNITIDENIYRMGSLNYFKLFNETRKLWKENKLQPSTELEKFYLESDLGKVGIYNGKKVLLDYPIQYPNNLKEAEYKGRDVKLNKPKRGGSAKFYVYVKDPKSGKVKKVSFGAKSGGGKLALKLKDPDARKAFASRHNCDKKKDKTTAGYWSCNIPKYAKQLGLSGGGNYYW